VAVVSESETSRPRRSPLAALWNDPRYRAVIYQLLVIAGVLFVVGYLVSNTMANLEQRQIATGFGFLDREAGFAISESMFSYDATDTYGRAFLVGLTNTFRVALIGVALATILGVIIGIARLSTNWLVAKLASAYVEVTRNVPLLLQLLVWYGVITYALPHPREAHNPLPGVFFSNRGIKLPAPVADVGWLTASIGVLVGIVGAIAIARWAKRRQDATGQPFPSFRAGLAAILGAGLVGWAIGGAPISISVPELAGFNFRGGMTLTPEFAAVLLGLTIYTAGFIAEIVRSGILAVSHGQTEAAHALGLRRNQVLRLVVLPQAMRIIIPPMTTQYLNLTKNSSLAVAVGYPDLVSIGNTTLNQTGQAIEAISIFMAVYLSLSLGISLFMNWYNSHIALVER